MTGLPVIFRKGLDPFLVVFFEEGAYVGNGCPLVSASLADVDGEVDLVVIVVPICFFACLEHLSTRMEMLYLKASSTNLNST